MLQLHLCRDILDPRFTLGTLHVNGLAFGYTAEDADRRLGEVGGGVKIRGITAIPLGTYMVRSTWSPKYGRMMPLVCEVPGFAGVRIHAGNGPADTEGCILPGLLRDPIRGTVGKSRAAVTWLYAAIEKAEALGERVQLTITRALPE